MGQNFLNVLNLVFANYIDMKGLLSVLRGHRFFLSTSSFYWFSNMGPSDTEKYLLLTWCWTVLPWRSSCWLWLMPFAEQLPYSVLFLGRCSMSPGGCLTVTAVTYAMRYLARDLILSPLVSCLM